MIDLCQWRASVGAFHAVQCSSAPLRKGGQVLLTPRRPMGFSVAILFLALLLLAGDVEENPGPPKPTRSQASLLSERVFKEFFSRVTEAIQGCLDAFAGELLSKDLIDWEAAKDVTEVGLSSTKKAHNLLFAVRSKIASAKRDKPLKRLCHVMEKFSVLKDLAKEMMERFEYLCSNDSSSSDSSGDEEPPTVAPRVDSSQLTTCAPTAKAPPAPSHNHPPSMSGTSSCHAPLASTPSAMPSPMEIYKNFLKSTYRCQSMPTYFKPDVTHGAKTYINLALVHRVEEKVQKREESVMYQFYGNVDVITKVKTPLDLKDVGWIKRDLIQKKESVTSLTRQILIEGAPGVGKTTLAWHLCRKWEEGELFQQWTVVVMLQLRDRQIRQAQTLNDLFYHSEAEVRQAVVSQVEGEEGSGVLLIFEGYDELSPSELTEDSIFVQLLKRKVIPAAAIMVTSRPLATGRLPYEFKESADLQHIEVVGFRSEDINDYITAACQDKQDVLEAFRSYLSCHPFVYSAMYNPLHCAIISQLYIMHWEKEEREFAPRTLTELYESLTVFLLCRYLCDLPVYSKQSLKFGQLSELPTEVYQQLMDVGRLAADGIERCEYIFDSVSFESMGFLRKVEDMYIGPGHVSSHSFLHLTLQEFLAAWYWSRTLSFQQLGELVRRHDLFPLDLFLKGMLRGRLSTSTMTHWPVLLFIAGLTKSTFGLEVAGRTAPNSEELVRPYLCRYLFECQSTQSVSSVFTGGRYAVNLKEIKSSLDLFVMGYSVAHSHAACLWKVLVKTNDGLEMFVKGLKYTLDSEKKERRVTLAEGQNSTSCEKEGGRIVSLHVEGASDIIHTLSPCTPHLSEVTFIGKLPSNVESFFNGISTHNSMLEDLRLWYALTPDELPPLVSNLSKLGNLAKLMLQFSGKFLKQPKSLSALESLGSCPHLTELTLRAPGFQPLEMPSALFSSLEPLLVSKLKVLTLEFILLSTSAAELALSHSLQSRRCSLVTLTLRQCTFLTNVSKQLAIGIDKNTSLHEVTFSACQWQSPEDYNSIDALRANKTHKQVVIQ